MIQTALLLLWSGIFAFQGFEDLPAHFTDCELDLQYSYKKSHQEEVDASYERFKGQKLIVLEHTKDKGWSYGTYMIHKITSKQTDVYFFRPIFDDEPEPIGKIAHFPEKPAKTYFYDWDCFQQKLASGEVTFDHYDSMDKYLSR